MPGERAPGRLPRWAPPAGPLSAPFSGAVARFLDEVTSHVEALGSRVPAIRADRLAGDVALDVFDLACALVDADGPHTDNELLALITTFGPLLETELGLTADDVVAAGARV